MITIELSLPMLEPEVAQAIWATECRRSGVEVTPWRTGAYRYKPLRKKQQAGNDSHAQWVAGGVNRIYDELCDPQVAAAADAAHEEIMKAHYEQARRINEREASQEATPRSA